MDRIGFVGVGLMGHGMARNIVEKGWPLTVVAHRKREAVEDLITRGATEAADLPALAAASDVVILCLTGSPQVQEALALLVPALKPGSVVVDCSTSDPLVTDRIAAEMATRGVGFADAPLSRTPKEAWEGTLDCMVGADPETLARILPVLRAFAARVIETGLPGTAHRMKLLNNFIAMGYANLYAEALTLAARTGISAQTFDNVIRGGRMDCGFYQTFIDYTLNANRDAHKFTLSNAAKDMRYLEAMANAAGVPTPMASAVKNGFALALGLGGSGPQDYVPHLPDFIARAAGNRQ